MKFLRIAAVAAFVMHIGNNVWGQTSPQTFNSNGTFIIPAGVASITIEAWGGGGGGGGSSSNNNGGSGGGGGGYTSRTFAVTPGQSIPYTVGTGGAGGRGQ